jgi:myosin heavy subunit
MHKGEARWIVAPTDKGLSVPFLRGTPRQVLNNDQMEYEVESSKGKFTVVAKLQDTYEMSKGDLYSDMCEMNILNEPEVLRNIIDRYRKDEIFTYIGPTLIVLNPYRIIERHFNKGLIAELRNKIVGGDLKGAPHIYMIAGRAYQGLICG